MVYLQLRNINFMMVLIEQTHPETIVSIQLLMSRFTSLKVSLSVRLPSKFHLCILTIIKTPRKKGEKLNSLAHNQTRNYHKLYSVKKIKFFTWYSQVFFVPRIYMWKYTKMFCEIRPWNYYHFIICSILILS